MNKRFSTLLAAVLVAGSSFSAMAGSPVEVDTLKYYQITAGDSKALIIGQGKDGAKDSLALIEMPAANASSLKDYNESLWRIVVDKTTDPTTGARYAVVKLVNKNGQQLILSNASAANKSFYYSKPAYVSTSGTGAWAPSDVTLEGKDEVITVKDGGMSLVTTSYSNGKSIGLYLAYKGNDVKILKVEEEGGIDKLEFPDDAGATGELKLVPAPAATEFALADTDLNEDATTDAFSLKFTPDTLASAIGNPFTDNKLVAMDLTAMYSTAVYDTDAYEKALKAAKEATAEANAAIDEAWGAFKTEANEAFKSVEGQTFTGKFTDAAGNKTNLAAVLEVLGQAATSPTGKLASLADADNSAGKLFDAAVKVLTDIDHAEESKALATTDSAGFGVAVLNADAAWKALKDSTAKSYSAIETVVADYVAQAYNTEEEGAPTFEGTAAGTDGARKAMFLENGFVYKQYADAIAKELKALAEAAVADMVKTASDDIMAASKPAAGYYALAIKDSLIDGKQAYLCVDTNYIARNEQYFGFKADTLMMINPEDAEDGVVADFGQCINLFAFQLVVNPQNVENDEILINTFMPTPTEDDHWYSEGIEPIDANVVLRTLAKDAHREVSVASTDDAQIEKLLKNTVITFSTLEGPRPDFKKGEVYFIKSLKKDDTRKPYRIISSTSNGAEVGATAVYNNVPSNQWLVSAVTEEGKFTFINRDNGTPAEELSNVKVIVSDAEKNIYVTAGKDTLEITAVPETEDEYLGYKHINDADKDHLTFKLTATNFVNPEAKYYLTMGADSSVVATADADKALELKAKNGGWLYNLADENLSAASYGFEMYLGNDTLYFTEADDHDLLLTKVATEDSVKLRAVNDNANQYELLWNVNNNEGEGGNLVSPKIAIDQNGKAAVVAEDEITNWAFNLESSVTESYLNVTDAPKNVTISLMGDEASKVTAVKPFAVIKRTGLELKAAATDNDFVLGLDTAYVNRPNNYRYAYYITKPVDTAKVGSFDTKAYMVSYTDSITHNSDTVKYNQDNLTRIGFVHANRVEFGKNDSLAIAKVGAKSTDTLNIAVKKGITNATWAFAIDEDNEGYYRIEVAPAASKTDRTYVSYLNGILVLGNKEQAQLFAINDTDLTPTDNEVIATSEVAVIAGEGQVTIVGAQGKKVIITNLLGQTVANTVLTSDNVTIAAPAGVVVVAIEGEEAVKAIVK